MRVSVMGLSGILLVAATSLPAQTGVETYGVRASPITYVKPSTVPILTVHGDKDRSVSLDQALMLDARMKEVGVPHTLIIERRRGHTDELGKKVWDFLESALKQPVAN